LAHTQNLAGQTDALSRDREVFILIDRALNSSAAVFFVTTNSKNYLVGLTTVHYVEVQVIVVESSIEDCRNCATGS